jgi:hypothetical protein
MENLSLIDWRMVGFASLWIVGLAVLLTVLGFANYHADLEARRMRDLLRETDYQMAINAGLTLFCLGLIGSARTWWERLLWGALALSFGYFTVRTWTVRRSRIRINTDQDLGTSSDDEEVMPPD